MKHAQPVSQSPFGFAIVAGGAVLCYVLCWWCYRGVPNVGFDSHYYLEYVKNFTHEVPTSFGTHWPYGYPLLGAAVHHLGLSAYASLLVVSAAGLACILALSRRILSEGPAGGWAGYFALIAIACASVVTIELGTVRSEIAFTALFLAFLASLAEWPRRGAIVASAVLLVLSFTIRYAGVLAFGPFALWIAVNWRSLDAAKAHAAALTAIVVAMAICVGLLALNRATSGHLSGGEREQSASLASLPGIVSDMGWSGILAVTTFGLRAKFVASPFLLGLIGWTSFLALMWLALDAWLKPRHRFARPLALGLAGYLCGMVAMRFSQDFDALYNARSFIPALPLALCLLATRAPRVALAAGAMIILFGVAIAGRGISPEIAPDFTAPLQFLKSRIRPSDIIAVNEEACGLSARTDCVVMRIDAGPLGDKVPRFTLLAAQRLGRQPTFAQKPFAKEYSAQLRREGNHALVFSNAEFELWERRPIASTERRASR